MLLLGNDIQKSVQKSFENNGPIEGGGKREREQYHNCPYDPNPSTECMLNLGNNFTPLLN